MKGGQGVLSPQVSPGGRSALAVCVLVPAPHPALSGCGNPLNHRQELEPGIGWMLPNRQESQLESAQPLPRRQDGGHWLEGWRDAGR